MVPVQQVKNGLARFVDDEVVAGMSGWQKIAVSTAAGLAINRLTPKLEALPLDLYKDGQVDVEAIYQEAVQHWSAPVPVSIPMIGTITLTKDNLDKLYSLIIAGGATSLYG